MHLSALPLPCVALVVGELEADVDHGLHVGQVVGHGHQQAEVICGPPRGGHLGYIYWVTMKTYSTCHFRLQG